MLEPASIQPSSVTPAKLTVVPHRYRDAIDRKTRYLFFKRIFDILFAIIFIAAVLSWLLPLLALLIKLSTRGSIFFSQKRVGFGGRSFTCYKLRTMVPNENADTLQAADNDKRITPIGRFLRKSNMDEFPQFFNVIKGDMSIVGPRPHMLADCNYFSSVLPGYKFRNMVRPGLTGLAQIKGYHGPTESRDGIWMRFHWDRFYITHIGFLLDMSIILRTIGQRVAALIRMPFPDPKKNRKKYCPVNSYAEAGHR
jgi:putative colanic acid biosynthesis UDP-glucose lipid carrier transferase